jgi:hypothetical protein
MRRENLFLIIHFFDVGETKPKFMLDLRTASITQGRRKNDERYFVITNKLGETLQVTFENYAQYKKWGDVFVESMQSDE